MNPADPPLDQDSGSLRWRALRAPKHGHTDAEYEDAWAAYPEAGRFAVADGASESSSAGLWARLLTEEFVAARRPWDLADWLDAARGRWSTEVTGDMSLRVQPGGTLASELPWYAEIKRDEGAFATLLGLRVRPPTSARPGRWRAMAVGDSCLVRAGSGRQVRSFPLSQSAEFGNQPVLIGSRERAVPPPRRCSGSLRPGDRLYLMTDALAQWFLHCHENGGQPVEAIAPLLSAEHPEDAFAAWVEEMRAGDAMRDDDVTLLIVEYAIGA